eukprot:5308148-Amphidinium_carterae.1
MPISLPLKNSVVEATTTAAIQGARIQPPTPATIQWIGRTHDWFDEDNLQTLYHRNKNIGMPWNTGG